MQFVTSKTKEEELQRVQLYYLDNLKIAMTKLKEVAERTLAKIENEGTAGYYSANSEVTSIMASAYRASLGLAEMKRLEIHFVKGERDDKS